jgi:Domain of unknown function (DUF3427)
VPRSSPTGVSPFKLSLYCPSNQFAVVTSLGLYVPQDAISARGQSDRMNAFAFMSTRPKLILYEEYSREEVHNVFSPDTIFTPQAGTWGLQGVVPIPDRPGVWVFFVTFGQTQGEHTFDEGITEDGVLTWQSQPQQSLNDRRVQQWINHDDLTHNIYLFLRTSIERRYAYLGRLKYLEHDRERQRPVYFQWQIIDWSLSLDNNSYLIFGYRK